MEESEKRKERLRAMRLEAAQAEVCSNVESSTMPTSLSNPLVETPRSQSAQEQTCGAPRFDFYTDPMSAFSANKRKGQPDDHISGSHFIPRVYTGSPMERPSSFPGPRHPGMPPSPSYQMQSNPPFHQRMYQTQAPYNNAATFGSPRGMVNPPPMMPQPSPQTWNEHRAGSTGSYNTSSNISGGGHNFSPGFGPVGSPGFSRGQGRPPWHGNSQNPNTSLGRGGSHWQGGRAGPNFGRSGGRGRGFHPRGGSQGPESFYHKSMDEDPWQHLEAQIWSRSSKGPGSSNSWLPKSINVIKPRVSENSNRSGSQPSLAEYLAASFNDAVKDTSS